MNNKSKTSHFHIFGCEAYVFLPSEVYANKLLPHSELMIFIRYENNRYYFIYHIQENIISHSTHAIFNERLFPKCTDSYTKEHKLYDKLLDKISSETKLLVPDSSGKDRAAPVSTSHTPNPSIQNNPLTHSSSPFLSYKSTFLLSILRFKKPTVEIEEDNNIDSDVEIQLPSPQ